MLFAPTSEVALSCLLHCDSQDPEEIESCLPGRRLFEFLVEEGLKGAILAPNVVVQNGVACKQMIHDCDELLDLSLLERRDLGPLEGHVVVPLVDLALSEAEAGLELQELGLWPDGVLLEFTSQDAALWIVPGTPLLYLDQASVELSVASVDDKDGCWLVQCLCVVFRNAQLFAAVEIFDLGL